jgi:2-keto-4-pentenoate hydratase
MKNDSDYAAALVAAHAGHAAASETAAAPQSLAEAMRVQSEVAQALRASVGGWKVGFAPDGTAVAGPMFASVVSSSPSSRALPAGGFIVEIELAFRLARDLPARAYSRDEILDAASEALIGIELVAGRLGEPPSVPYPAFLADNIGNAGYVVGASTRSFRALDLKALRCTFRLDGNVVQDREGGHPQGDPVEPLRAYASAPSDVLGGLRKGQVVTTGSLTKPLRVDRAARIEATLAGIGDVTLELT